MIPAEAVEAAAKALREAFDWGVDGFDEQAKRAIEVASSHMLGRVSTLDELVILEPGTILQGPDFHGETYKCTAPGTFHAIASPVEYRASDLVCRGPFTIIYRPVP